MVTLEDVREIAAGLPRSYEVVVHGRVKFRIDHDPSPEAICIYYRKTISGVNVRL